MWRMDTGRMSMDFLSINDVSSQELRALLDVADAYSRGAEDAKPLAGKSVALLFEKPSLRTRVSFDIAVNDLGGHPVYVGPDEVGLDTRERAEDTAHVLERWVSIIVARVFAHSALQRLADASNVPVVNALSDVEHPCQALADLLTIRQRLGTLEGKTVAYIGDANNCALSLGLGCAASEARFVIASPQGYGLDDDALASINQRYEQADARVTAVHDPDSAVEGADVVYTDVWTSMGQEKEAERRHAAFAGYQVNEALLRRAKPGALFMHPMPAHYGEEVPPGMLEHPRSVAYHQAENRLHAQKSVLHHLTAGE